MLYYVPRCMNLGRWPINTCVRYYAGSWRYDVRLYTTHCSKYKQEYRTSDHVYSLRYRVGRAITLAANQFSKKCRWNPPCHVMQGFLASFSDLTFDTREKEKNAIKNESYVARTSRSSMPSFLSFNEKKSKWHNIQFIWSKTWKKSCETTHISILYSIQTLLG